MPIVYRQDKGASLTYAEMDNNLFELDARLAKADKCRTGFFDLDDTATASSPINATDGATWYKITNNNAGPQSLATYAPEGITTIWNSTNGQFDFTQMSLGDTIHIRATLELTTTAVNQEVSFRLRCGIGDGNVYNIPAGRLFFKAAGSILLGPFALGRVTSLMAHSISVKSDRKSVV